MEITVPTIVILSLGLAAAMASIAGSKARECKRLRAELAATQQKLKQSTQDAKDVKELLELGWVCARTKDRYTIEVESFNDDVLAYLAFKAPDEDKPRPFREAVERQKELVKCRRLNVPLSDDEVLGWRELTEK